MVEQLTPLLFSTQPDPATVCHYLLQRHLLMVTQKNGCLLKQTRKKSLPGANVPFLCFSAFFCNGNC